MLNSLKVVQRQWKLGRVLVSQVDQLPLIKINLKT